MSENAADDACLWLYQLACRAPDQAYGTKGIIQVQVHAPVILEAQWFVATSGYMVFDRK